MRWNKLSTQNPSVEQFLAQRRNDLVIFQQKASEISTKTFDELAQQIMQLGQIGQRKDLEIKRLQELCDKNKVEYKPKAPQPAIKQAPPPKK